MENRSGQQVGNYRLVHLLGVGGFAEVYLAEHIYLKTKVAVKVLHTHLAQAEFADFLQEAQTIARLKHPHIIPVFDFGIDGTPYLVMDYVPHGALRQRHPRGTQVPFTAIVSYVVQIASALQYAHDSKVIHRDVKPENILINSANAIILSDFGIATAAHRTSSLKTVNASGTPVYMAPEHIAGKPRPASDQYALGIVVYEWFCGMPPFVGEPMAVMYQQTHTPVPPLSDHDTTISDEIEQIILRALAKDPQDRFDSIQAFAAALELEYLVEEVKKQLVTRIVLGLKRTGLETQVAQRMPSIHTLQAQEAQALARDFLALGSFHDKRTLLEGLKILGKTHKAAESLYLDASAGLEEFARKNVVLLEEGKVFHEKAIADYTQALQLDPKSANTYRNRGDLYHALQQTDKDIADYTQALQLDPKNANTYWRRGNAYRGLQQYDKAIQDYDQSLELNPQQPGTQKWRQKAYRLLQGEQ
jgi:serine/threonine protein kinase